MVLEGSTLHTFKKEKDYANPTEIIDLKVFSSVKSSEDQTHKPFSFDVYSPESRFSFVAKSENDKEDWIRHIGKAIVLSNTKVRCHGIEYRADDPIPSHPSPRVRAHRTLRDECPHSMNRYPISSQNRTFTARSEFVTVFVVAERVSKGDPMEWGR